MAEKRRPYFKIVATKNGKKKRFELFSWHQWKTDFKADYRGRIGFRLRINGKWQGTLKEPITWTLTEFCDNLRKWMSK